MLAKATRNLTAGAPTTFVDTEDDHNVDRPPVQPLGWASDNQHVLLFDNWDVWKAPVRGGAGRQRRYRAYVLAAQGGGLTLAAAGGARRATAVQALRCASREAIARASDSRS